MKPLFLLTVFVLAAVPATAATPYLSDKEIAAQVERDFAAALDLWRDGRFEDLYERLSPTSLTRERFVRTLSECSRRPACCWDKLQEVRVKVVGPEDATLQARVGLETAGATEYATRSFRLANDGGTWKIPAADVLSLAGRGSATKKLKKGDRSR